MLVDLRYELVARVAAERARMLEVEARIAQIELEGRVPRHEVAIRSMDAVVAVGLRQRCRSYDEVGNLLQSLRACLLARATIGGYGAIWHSCG